MFLFYRGRGDWLLYFPFAVFALTAFAFSKLGAGRQNALFALAGAALICALFAFGLGLHTMLQKPRVFLEPRSGREFLKRPVHSAYGIPAILWMLPYLALTLYLIRKATQV